MRIFFFIAALLPAIATAQVGKLDSLKQERESLQARIGQHQTEISRLNARLNNIDREIVLLSVRTVEHVWAVVTTAAKVRSGPHVKTSLIRTVPKGDSVLVIGADGSYWKLHDGSYVSNLFVKYPLQREEVSKQLRVILEAGKQAKLAREDSTRAANLLKPRNGRRATDSLDMAFVSPFRKKGAAILLFDVDSSIDTAGGAGVSIRWRPIAKKTIKYIRYKLVAYNEVGDVVRGSIKRTSTSTLLDTGPHEFVLRNGPQWSSWDPLLYNSSITCMKITRAEVEFMDGTKAIYVRDLPNLLADGFTNDCSYEAQKKRRQG